METLIFISFRGKFHRQLSVEMRSSGNVQMYLTQDCFIRVFVDGLKYVINV